MQLDVPFFHSKLGTASDRDMLLGQFTGRTEPPVRIIICTNAFGMGLGLPDVRLIVHWQHTASPEDYLQEFGRAGRDGRPSVAVFTGQNDEGLLQFMAEKTSEMVVGDTMARELALKEKLESIQAMRSIATSTGTCVRESIVSYFGEIFSSAK